MTQLGFDTHSTTAERQFTSAPCAIEWRVVHSNRRNLVSGPRIISADGCSASVLTSAFVLSPLIFDGGGRTQEFPPFFSFSSAPTSMRDRLPIATWQKRTLGLHRKYSVGETKRRRGATPPLKVPTHPPTTALRQS